jgi:hypothetical protein
MTVTGSKNSATAVKAHLIVISREFSKIKALPHFYFYLKVYWVSFVPAYMRH